jgi:hypothetical protein
MEAARGYDVVAKTEDDAQLWRTKLLHTIPGQGRKGVVRKDGIFMLLLLCV